MGFSFIELLIAMTVAAAVMAIAIPRSAPGRDRAGVKAAKQAVSSYLSMARQTAIRRGGTAVFTNSSNVIKVTSTVSGTTSTIGPALDVKDQHGVELGGAVTTITYRARGFATPRLDATKTLYLTRGGAKDSLCVTILGITAKCGL